jgi:hypothetical protein
LPRPRGRGQACRLRMEATETIRPSGSKARHGVDVQGASSKAHANAWVRSGHPSVAILLRGQGPGGQRPMTTDPVVIIPHGVDCGAGCRRPPPRAGPARVETGGEGKTCPLSERPLGKVGTQPVMADVCCGLALGQRLPEPVPPQSQRTLGHAWMDGCRSPRHRLVPWRPLRRPWRSCWGGVTPGPTGDEGQQQVAGPLRRACAQARATRGGFDSVGRKEVCYYGDRTTGTGGPGSLPGLVSRCERPSTLPPRGDCFCLW